MYHERKWQKCVKVLPKNLQGTNYLGDGRIGSHTNYCEHGNEPYGSINGGEYEQHRATANIRTRTVFRKVQWLIICYGTLSFVTTARDYHN